VGLATTTPIPPRDRLGRGALGGDWIPDPARRGSTAVGAPVIQAQFGWSSTLLTSMT
jgi:hypothetical protein